MQCDKVCHRIVLLQHIYNTHCGERIWIKIMWQDFLSNSYLERHIRTHTEEKPYHCNYCITISLTSVIKTHMRTDTGDKPYPCIWCENTFGQINGLIRPQKTHTGEKPYQCNHFEKAFSVKPYLKVHQRTYTG